MSHTCIKNRLTSKSVKIQFLSKTHIYASEIKTILTNKQKHCHYLMHKSSTGESTETLCYGWTKKTWFVCRVFLLLSHFVVWFSFLIDIRSCLRLFLSVQLLFIRFMECHNIYCVEAIDLVEIFFTKSNFCGKKTLWNGDNWLSVDINHR